jgi:hypothetical protein
MWVQNDDGSYRPLDQRTLTALQRADTHTRGVNTIIDEAMDEQNRAQDAIQKAAQDNMRDAARDMPRGELAKQADADGFGATNIPQEDVDAAMLAQYGEEALETFA